mgnify:CR=1 FL=1
MVRGAWIWCKKLQAKMQKFKMQKCEIAKIQKYKMHECKIQKCKDAKMQNARKEFFDV